MNKKNIILITLSFRLFAYTDSPTNTYIMLPQYSNFHKTDTVYLNDNNTCTQCNFSDKEFYDDWIITGDVSCSNFINAKFIYGKLAYTTFRCANLRFAQFNYAFANNAIFEDAKLEKASFLEAELTETIFDKADCTQAEFDRCHARHASFVNTELKGASLKNGNFSLSNFSGANLFMINALNATFDQANLTGCNISYSNLDLTKVKFANLSGADLSHSNFGQAEIMATDMSNTNLTHTYFKGAQLINVDFRGATILGTDFEDANLTGSKFDPGALEKARICNTLMPEEEISFRDCTKEKNLIARLKRGKTRELSARPDAPTKEEPAKTSTSTTGEHPGTPAPASTQQASNSFTLGGGSSPTDQLQEQAISQFQSRALSGT